MKELLVCFKNKEELSIKEFLVHMKVFLNTINIYLFIAIIKFNIYNFWYFIHYFTRMIPINNRKL